MKVDSLPTWHREVCKRDGYKCRVCDKDYDHPMCFLEDGRNSHVCGHHVKTRKAFPELTLDVNNGVCVDLGCHNDIHKGLVSSPENSQTKNETWQAVDPNILKDIPWALKDWKPGEMCRKCKKYYASSLGLCLQCEPFRGHNLKIKKEKSNKK